MIADLTAAPAATATAEAAPARSRRPPNLHPQRPRRPPRHPRRRHPAATAPTPSAAQTAAAQAEQLARSARPPRATPAAASVPADTRPPADGSANPLPLWRAEPAGGTGSGPRGRPSRPAAAPVAQSAPASAPSIAPQRRRRSAQAARRSHRHTGRPVPPARPKRVPLPTRPRPRCGCPGTTVSTPALAPRTGCPCWTKAGAPEQTAALTQAERDLIIAQLRDLRTAQAGNAPLSQASADWCSNWPTPGPRAGRSLCAHRRNRRCRTPSGTGRRCRPPRPAGQCGAASLAAPRPAAIDPGHRRTVGRHLRSARPNSRPGTRTVASPRCRKRPWRMPSHRP